MGAALSGCARLTGLGSCRTSRKELWAYYLYCEVNLAELYFPDIADLSSRCWKLWVFLRLETDLSWAPLIPGAAGLGPFNFGSSQMQASPQS